MATFTYHPRGVCAKQMDLETDGDRVGDVVFHGGCNGNLKAISKLIKGMKVDDVIATLEGNTCGPRSTSCADQLAQALRDATGLEQPAK